MASPPYKVIDKRAATGYANNQLYSTATQTGDRKSVQLNNYDFHRNVSALGRITMMSLGRKIYADFPMVKGAVMEQSNLAVSSFIPQFYGADSNWGNLAEEWLGQWHRFLNLRGSNHDFDSYVSNLISGVLIDGDVGTLLTETDTGSPRIQIIPSHRIRSWVANPILVTVRDYQNQRWIEMANPNLEPGDKNPQWQLIDDNLPQMVEDPTEFQARLIDGVVVNDFGAPIAYALGSENIWDMSLTFVSARNFFLTYIIEYPDQLRGLSQLANAAYDYLDVSETRAFEKIAQKAGAGYALIETNEAGEIDPAKAVITAAPTDRDSDNNATSLTRQVLDGGLYKYFRAGTGSKLEAFRTDRPTEGQMQFEERVLRGAFTGMEWSMDFSLDPSKVGGAQMRIVIEKINEVLNKRRKMVSQAAMRVDGYALSKAIKGGILPPNKEWYKWEYQGPAELTADKKYDSQVDETEFQLGFRTLKNICARRGEYYEDVRKQRVKETSELLADAKGLADTYKLPIETAINLLEQRQQVNPQKQMSDFAGDQGGSEGEKQ